MDQGTQAHAYQTLPRRDSDSHLPAGGDGGASAEHGIQISELGQDAPIPQKPPSRASGSPTATDASGAATATDAAAVDQPLSELDLQKGWKLLDWNVAFFFCSSLVYLVVRHSIAAIVCACISSAAAFAHLWRRRQRARGDDTAEALAAAMSGFGLISMLTMVLGGGVAGGIWISRECPTTQDACAFHAVYAVSWLYYLSCFFLSCEVMNRHNALFPEKPHVEVLRERAQEFKPDPLAHRAQALVDAAQQLAGEERKALYEFERAEQAGNAVKLNEAHGKWREVVEKLRLLKEEPEQYLQQHGTPASAGAPAPCVAV